MKLNENGGLTLKKEFAAVALAVSAATVAFAVEFPNPADFNPIWESAKPGSSRSTDLPTGALLGNGSLGAVNGGDGNHKHFVLTRGDIWSCGDFTCGKADHHVRPISFADFSIGPGMHSVKSTDTLDLPSATLRTEGGFGKGRVKIETYVASTEDLLVLTGVSDTDDSWAVHLTAHRERKPFPIEVKSSKESFYVRRSTINLLPQGDPRGWTTNATAALSVLGTELENFSIAGEGHVMTWAKIRANVPFAFVVSSDPSRRFTWDELAKLKSAHNAWWKEWWSRSRVTTGDAELDRFYCGQVYLLGAGVRKGKFPPGLYGIWVTTDNAKWHNDFHLNYNYVGTYYGCFAANRCEVADAMPDPLIAYLPQAIRNAKEVLPHLDRCKGRFYKNTRAYLDSRPDVAGGIDDAALYPVALGPWGTSAEGHGSHWSQVSDGAFQCAVMCTHWEYTLDRAYLKKVWPVLDKTANFFLKWCEKEATPDGGYRYNVWDSHWEGSGLAKNSAPALGCVKHLFETLVDVAPVLREMGIDVPAAKLAAWKDMHEHLSPLAVGVYPINGKPVKMLSGVENADGSANPSGGNAINLESVIPGEQFAFDVTPEFRELAKAAVDGNIAKAPNMVWSGINQTPKLFATAIRAGYPAQAVIEAFKKHQLSIMQKNFHIHDGVHGVEKIGAMEFVQSMLIQCDHGFVKVFPNWTGADAKFENLRAKGCFLVSAEMKGGKVVRVEVKSEKGGRFRLVDPRQQVYNNKLPEGWSRGKTRNSGEATLERDFKPGETIVLNPSEPAVGKCDPFGGGVQSAEIYVDGRKGSPEAAILPDGTVTLQSTGAVSKIELVWKCDLSWVEKTFAGDWERCYGFAGWRKMDPAYPAPWYCLVTGGGRTDGYGVMVQPAAFATWKLSPGSARLVLDVRAGRKPVRLGGRRLELCRVVSRRGVEGEGPFEAGRAFCKMMCPSPRLPKAPVYGYNDWYCAYGRNTATNFLSDAAEIIALCDGLANRPFVVVDDGWQSSDFRGGKVRSEAQWSVHNANWGMPMDEFCRRVKAMGARPGLWYRPFYADKRTERNGIDPANPRWSAQIAADMKRFREWGIELVKIDYITYDWSPRWNFRPQESVLDAVKIDWSDDTRTAAETVRDLYRAMRTGAGDGICIIGCNAIDHFAAGLFELQRIGDDTSGKDWSRTLKMGPNAVAMRAIHNNIFYFNDGDCVGLATKGAVPWDKNAQWLDLVARSGTSLFVSWRRELLDADVRKALKDAFRMASRPQETGEPLDWTERLTPARWKFGPGEEKTYNW